MYRADMQNTAGAGKKAGSRVLFCLLLSLLVLSLALFGCKSDKEEEAKPQNASSEKADKGSAAKDAQKGDVKSYALSEPQAPASEEERDHAAQVVEYANNADGFFSKQSCAQEPARIMAGVLLYKQEYTAIVIGDKQPEACLRKGLGVPDGLFSEEDAKTINTTLEKMDRQRTSMRSVYDKLCEYIQDPEIVDNGAKGASYTKKIGEYMVGYAKNVTEYRKVVQKAALDAQAVLLKGHPLHDHVLLAMDIASIIRSQAEVIALSEPDPAELDAPLASLEEKITTADRLPFPMAGAPEMYYRHFLKEAAGMAALFRTGQKEAFHTKVREDLNKGWADCQKQYNLFVDEINAQ